MKGSEIITFNTKNGPKALGPYSTAKIYNGVMYVSGNIGIVPETGELISDKVDEQTERLMENLKIILGETNSSFGMILKCTIYLKVRFVIYFRVWMTLPRLMKCMGNIFRKIHLLEWLLLLLLCLRTVSSKLMQLWLILGLSLEIFDRKSIYEGI